MNKPCQFCNALRFKNEANFCCHKKVNLPPQNNTHPELLHLLTTNNSFRNNIRKYNQAFAFTSLGGKVDHNMASNRNGVYTFRVCGDLYHRIGSLLPEVDGQEKFCQIYFLDYQTQNARRQGVFNGSLDDDILNTLNRVLRESNNPYVQQFQNAKNQIGISNIN